MSRSMGNTIADSLQLSLSYATRLLTDVQPDQFARFASPGGVSVVSNHAAFVYGHLSLYAPRILKALNLDSPEVPEGFEAVFSKDAVCADDPNGSVYPEMTAVTDFFFQGYHAAMEAFRGVNDDVLQQPNPTGGRMTELFPTLGSMQNFYVGGHMMLHLGQVSAWRRMMGLGAA
ncbi:MAG: hypothetical protein R3C49_09640 [Planctomycetaceae bacterium]